MPTPVAVTSAISEICGRFCILFSCKTREMKVPRWENRWRHTMGRFSRPGIRLSRRRAGACRREDDPMHAFSRGNTYCIYVGVTTTLCKYVLLCEPGKLATEDPPILARGRGTYIAVYEDTWNGLLSPISWEITWNDIIFEWTTFA